MDTQDNKCLSPQRISSCMHGWLTDAEAREVLDHLATCSTCAAHADTVSVEDDPLFRGIRMQPQANLLIDPGQVSAIVAKLGALPDRASPTSEPFPSQGPARLSNYTLLEKVGRGGMGDVWKATDNATGETVAVKLIASNLLASAEVEQRFRREAEAMQNLKSPHVVAYRDFGIHEGTHFLVMEWIDGIDLKKKLRNHGPFDVAEACRIVRQACRGLADIHAAGLIHRDIKPSNLLLSEDGTVHIVDFGLVRNTSDDVSQHTVTGQVLGTFDYMAPEQLRGSRVSSAADIYSAGCTFFELLTGSLLPGVPTDQTEIPEDVATLIADMTNRDPARRPSAGDVADRLSLLPVKSAEGISSRQVARRPWLKRVVPLVAAILLCIAGWFVFTAVTGSSPDAEPISEHLARLDWQPDTVTEPLPGLVPHPTKIEGISRWQLYSEAPRSALKAMAWSHSGKHLAMTTYDGLTRVYKADGDSPELHSVLPETDGTLNTAFVGFSYDDRFLATANEQSGTVRIWEIGFEQESRCRLATTISLPNAEVHRVASMDWHPFRRQLAIGTYDRLTSKNPGRVIAWQLSAEGAAAVCYDNPDAHSASVRSIAWTPDGRSIVSAGADRLLRKRSVDNSQPAKPRRLRSSVLALAVDPANENLIIADEDNRLSLLDGDLSEIASITSPESGISRLIVRDNGRVLIGGKKVWTWNPLESSELELFADVGKVWVPTVFDLNSVDHRVAVADPFISFLVYPPDSGAATHCFDEGDVRLHSLDAHPTNHNVWAIGLADGSVLVWDSASATTKTVATHEYSIGAVAFSPDGTRIASSDMWNGNAIQITPLNESDLQRRWLFEHQDAIPALSWSPDSVWLASASHDGSVRVTNTITPRQIQIPPLCSGECQMRAVAFRPDGRRLAFAGDAPQVHIHHGASEGFKELRVLALPRNEKAERANVESLAWAPDGASILVSVLPSNELIVLNADTGEELRNGKAQKHNYSAQWSNDNRFLFSGTYGLLTVASLDPIRKGFGKHGVFSRDGTSLVYSQNGSLGRFDLTTMESVQAWTPHRQSGVTFSAAGVPSASTPLPALKSFHCLLEHDDGRFELLTASEFYQRFGTPLE